ncbi:MAG: putative bifunctional diguanylate cyclase/phosphodiesterase [Gammaproteobacteria bacterium]
MFQRPSLDSRDRSSLDRAKYDLILLLVFSIGLTLLAAQMGTLSLLLDWSIRNNGYDIGQVLTIPVLLSFAIALFAWRRIRELKNQLRLQRQVERKIQHMAMHDALTGLPNRVLFGTRVEQELSRARREGSQLAVFALDLDQFKPINDAHGHVIGDALLVAVAARLENVLRKVDSVARLGVDEFAIIQPGLEQPFAATVLGTRIVRALTEPFFVEGHTFVSSVSVGVTLSTSKNEDPVELLRAADVALSRSKAQSGSAFRFFEPEMDAQLRARQALERDLRKAVDTDRLELRYQPIFDITEGRRLSGFEALVRWKHPDRGWVSPCEFIPIAEESGLIRKIGRWVLLEACRTATTWPESITVQVNVSPLQFKHPSFLKAVKAVRRKTGLARGRLELEITESVLIEDSGVVLKTLRKLKALGVRISMDDFGTGYSSLSYLRQFPFDKLKIDRSFVADLENNHHDAAIVAAVAVMGRRLGIVTLAEGIESAGQLECIAKVGCQEAQGFLLGKPITGAETMRLLEKVDEQTTEAASASGKSAAWPGPLIQVGS